jgi:signal transduction histidine kinase
VIVNFLSNAVKFSPIGSQIVIQMTEGETRPGVPAAPDRAARDAKDKKKKSMWSRVSMSQSPERSAEGTFVVQCRVCLRDLSRLSCLASKHTAVTSIAQLHTSLFR